MSFLDRILGRGREEPGEERGAEPAKAAHVPGGDVDLEPPDPDEAPRGGMQTDEYRHADPRDVVESSGTLMAGPGGSPQDSGPTDDPDARDLEDPEKQE